MAGYVFITGNLTLLAKNIDFQNMSVQPDVVGLTSAGLLLTAAAIYPFTKKRPKLFGLAGACVVGAQGIIAGAASGVGKWLQRGGTILPSIQGILMIRKAWNSAHGDKHFTTDRLLLKPLEVIDKRPILAGALIEGPGVALIAVWAGLSHDWALCAAATQWTLANIFLGVSDLKVGPIELLDSGVKLEA